MLAKIKLYAMAILGFLAALFFGLYQHTKAKFSRHKLKEAEETIKAEHDAQEASIESKVKGDKEVKNALNNADKSRNHFE